MVTYFDRIILFLVVLSVGFHLHAEALQEEKPLRPRHGLGLAAGGTSGAGVAYRGWSTNGFGIQTTLGAFGTSRYFDIFGGLELLYYFHETEGGHRWYALAGSGFVVESFRTVTLYPGAGVGIEFLLFQKLSISIGVALAPLVPIARPKNPIFGYFPLPFPDLAILYNF